MYVRMYVCIMYVLLYNIYYISFMNFKLNLALYIYIYIYICISNNLSASENNDCGLFIYRIFEGFYINQWKSSVWRFLYIPVRVYVKKKTHIHSMYNVTRKKQPWLNSHYNDTLCVFLGSIPSLVAPKTLKIVLDTSLFNTQRYKVRIKGKMEQSREWRGVLPYTSV